MSINGKPANLKGTLLDVLKENGITLETPGVAVAVNEEIIFRSFWHKLKLKDKDRIEIIHAVQGG